MSQHKKQIRSAFRRAVFERDGYRCVACGHQSSPERAEDELDAHHITNRKEMPNGGYVPENGVTLCKIATRPGLALSCHEEAERWLDPECVASGNIWPDYDPDTLYLLIDSSPEEARMAAEKLENQ